MEDATPSHYEQTEDTEIPYPNTVLRPTDSDCSNYKPNGMFHALIIICNMMNHSTGHRKIMSDKLKEGLENPLNTFFVPTQFLNVYSSKMTSICLTLKWRKIFLRLTNRDQQIESDEFVTR
ncbi:uncharacterized protein YALI1_A09654g [Yarrowia lipolytica]|uniref:Uncharacterized protein n=1 Tax=Yarrowia lipolytica TaxID=4952 RepID=A0A1D8N4A4_YARLL|nr:hypothetical protein YALI1_A09654g [Yarrowia lipolytica]